MFESAKAIREAKKAEIAEKARREGEERERQRIRKELEAHGITLPPIVAEAAFGNGTESDA